MKSSRRMDATLAAIGSCGARLIPASLSLLCSFFLAGVFTPGLCQLFPMLPASYLFLIIGCC